MELIDFLPPGLSEEADHMPFGLEHRRALGLPKFLVDELRRRPREIPAALRGPNYKES